MTTPATGRASTDVAGGLTVIAAGTAGITWVGEWSASWAKGTMMARATLTSARTVLLCEGVTAALCGPTVHGCHAFPGVPPLPYSCGNRGLLRPRQSGATASSASTRCAVSQDLREAARSPISQTASRRSSSPAPPYRVGIRCC